ncbi:MAG: GNAT family N-acetyltransferase [Limimaricola sp.]|uniref:GNAT family N-acetyltransferase n=1 Tax=Limimaricola sp. TaxID=2211665 RepID=UPI001D7FB2F3|nr:GNAT family protein [Limimaricola sp.]MBI1418406.1 GNAT family N-acetyltransferase [Limimaricola sp.]
MIRLLPARAADFDNLVAGRAPAGLSLPPGGLAESRAVLRALAGLGAGPDMGQFLIERQGMLAGLCGVKGPVADGAVEIGYGVAEAMRRQGVATSAVGLLLAAIARWRQAETVLALTDPANLASQRVLQRNGFSRVGDRADPERPLLVWQRPVQF